MTGNSHMTEDEADLKLLSLASDKRKFAVDFTYAEEWFQPAFERGIDREWFTLVDVSVVAAEPVGRLMKVFRLTDRGLARLAEVARALKQGDLAC